VPYKGPHSLQKISKRSKTFLTVNGFLCHIPATRFMAKQTNGCHRTRSLHPQLRGSLQKFCTLYVSSLKLNLFYKTHFQAFNVISIVLYHSSPTFGQVLYSRQDAFVVDASDYLGHLIRHLPKASEAFPMERFLQFWEQKTGGLMSELYGGWGRTCHPYFSKISDTAPEA